jgi:hypothetical protein
MATRNSTPKLHSKPAAVPVPARVDAPDCYDPLVSEIATLECVLATLSEWDLAGQPTGNGCHIASAELVLRDSIKRLHNLVGDVESMQSRIESEVAHV